MEKSKKVKVLALVGEHEEGNLWFEMADPKTPQRFFDFIENNMEENQDYTIRIEDVSKEDFDREE